MRRIRVLLVAVFCLVCAAQLPAQPPNEPPAVDADPPSVAELDSPDANPTAPRLLPWGSIQTQTGPGIGYQTSFSTLEGFVPVWQDERQLFFGDFRGFLSNTNLLGANLGAGYRYWNERFDRILGGNVFYDQRDTGWHTFHQVGFGLECLGRGWDARANAYFVVGDRVKDTFVFYSNPAFIQHFIQLDRLDLSQAAMSGFDAEVGVPISCRYGLKAYAGLYNFQVDGSRQAWGGKVRLEERLSDNLDLNLTYANDPVFGNSLLFQAAYRFGGRRRRAGAARCETYARRADRIERNTQIVVTELARRSQELACDPATGLPLVVVHADRNAPAGGDGTYERPFNRLLDLQNGSGPGQILLAHGGSTFFFESITLQDGQRFLGDGAACPHFFTACQGTFLLPRANSSPDQPLINNIFSGANLITLANDNEVSGFRTLAGSGVAIRGNGVTGFNLNCNQIQGGIRGISLDNISGAGRIAGNIIIFTSVEAIFLRSSALAGHFDVLNNSLANVSAQPVFQAIYLGDGALCIRLDGNSTTNAYSFQQMTGTGVIVAELGSNAGNVTTAGNFVTGPCP